MSELFNRKHMRALFFKMEKFIPSNREKNSAMAEDRRFCKKMSVVNKCSKHFNKDITAEDIVKQGRGANLLKFQDYEKEI